MFITIKYYVSDTDPINIEPNFNNNIYQLIIKFISLMNDSSKLQFVKYINIIHPMILIMILTNLIKNDLDTNQKLIDFIFKFLRNDKIELYNDYPGLQFINVDLDLFKNYYKDIKELLVYIQYKKYIEGDKFIIFLLTNNLSWYEKIDITFKQIEGIAFILKHNREIFKYLNKQERTDQNIINALIENHGLKKIYSTSSYKLKFIHIGFKELNVMHTQEYIIYIFMNFKENNVTTIITNINENLLHNNNNVVIFIDIVHSQSLTIRPPDQSTFQPPPRPPLPPLSSRSPPPPPPPPLSSQSPPPPPPPPPPPLSSRSPPPLSPQLLLSFYNVMQQFIDNTTNYTRIKIINYYKLFNKKWLLKYNKYFNKILNITFDSDPDNIKTCTKEGYNYKVLDSDDEMIDNIMLATHWINWQINTPYELKYRQLQQTETCWINSILNSLILVNEIKDY